jgi:hypothetical protein
MDVPGVVISGFQAKGGLGHVDDQKLFSDLPARLYKAAELPYWFDAVIMTETQRYRAWLDAEAVDPVSQFYTRWVSYVHNT